VEANGIRMNYLDWGGGGEPLVLVHGFGDNPHVFDDLAPHLADRFRVVAYARRGHGLTEAKPPYDGATLVQDLAALLDQLGIERAHLVGSSMGGNEVTAFAGLHPDRTRRIAYLDAAYDYADPACRAAWDAFPIDPSPPDYAMTAWPVYLAWHHEHMFPGVDSPARFEAYLRELALEQPDGSLKMRMDRGAGRALWSTLLTDRRDYTRIRARALAIYAATAEDIEHGDPAIREKFRVWEESLFAPFRVASVERIRKELPGVEVIHVPGTHSDFIYTSRPRVVDSLQRFLVA
jgi:pimeloyl-ACP methyl ester carboxylesterase